MKELSEKQIKEAAARAFGNHPGADKVYVTSDGQVFLPKFLSAANDHARKRKFGMFEITREEALKPKGKKVKAEENEPKQDDLSQANGEANDTEAESDTSEQPEEGGAAEDPAETVKVTDETEPVETGEVAEEAAAPAEATKKGNTSKK